MVASTGGPVFVPTVRAQAGPAAVGFVLNAGDLRFIFHAIEIAQAHSAGGELFGPGQNQVTEVRLPLGLRTVDGSFNHLVPGQEKFGASDQIFPRLTAPSFRPAEAGTSYTQKKGQVTDSQPRIITNLIVDQTASNPAAVVAAGPTPEVTPSGAFFIPNVAPDVGLSAPFNIMFTFFGQFFDHGLDLVNKGGSGTVFVPLQADDPLVAGPDRIFGNADDLPPNQRFMLISRATNLPGPDGVVGDDPATPQDESLDDIMEDTNQTTPFVDQNQTYTSHPSHQVFLRQYTLNAAGRPVSTGKMIDGVGANIGTWADIKSQAANMLGIALVDADVFNVPLLATDLYGYFKRGPNGFPQMVMANGTLREGNPAAPISTVGAVKTGHGFLDDIAHNAVPRPGLVADADRDISVFGVTVQPPGTYDNELLDRHHVTGDGRGNENIALTAVHTIFHSEHNRLATQIPGLINTLLTPAEQAAWHAVDPASGWDFGERVFQAAKFVTEMQYQHLVFEEFARKLVPSINEFIGDGINFNSARNPAIPAEFAHQTYRLGHSMLPEIITRTNEDGTSNDIPLLTAFLNPVAFTDGGAAGALTAAQAAGSVFQGGTRTVANEIDEFVTEAVRNNLLGLPLDLAAINLMRGRSEGVAPLNSVRRQLYLETGDPQLVPYQSWMDFEFNMKRREVVPPMTGPATSLINFIAAYGSHPTITAETTIAGKRAAATLLVDGGAGAPADRLDFLFSTGAWANDPTGLPTTGLEKVDLWVGGLAEKIAPFGSMLGTTFNYIFEVTLEDLQNNDRFYYLERLDGLNLLAQLEGNSFAELISRNTTLRGPAADVFSRPDLVLNLTTLLQTPGVITDDPTTPENEATMPDLVLLPDGTLRYNGPLHVIWNGRAVADRAISSEGDDTLRGDDGADRMEGGAGNDNHIGGAGDDILTDTFGEDVMKGGPGNDAIAGGSGPFDLLQGNEGHDFIVGGNDSSEVFGGPGNDVIYVGKSLTESFGGAGDDWVEGSDSPASVLVGDENNQFQNDPNGGHDVYLAGTGDADFDMEGGDDIIVGNVIPTHRFEGMLGFDWVTYRGETIPVDADMLVSGLFAVFPDINELRDRFDLTEGLSGSANNDLLRGDHRGPVELANGAFGTVPNGHVLTAAGIARISALAGILPPGATEFRGGNIILGGAGSDLIEGRGGDDILDGDRWLNVQLRATLNNGTVKLANSLQELKTDVFADPQRLNPGNIQIVRSIVTDPAVPADCGVAAPRNCDTAVFSGLRAEYLISSNADGSLTVQDTVALRRNPALGQGAANDGTDTLRNFERLQFADGVIAAPGAAPVGTPVPNIVGQTQAAAQTAITNAGLVSSITRANNPAVACGIVIDQSPIAGTGVAAGSTVSFTVSLGPAVPDVHDETIERATRFIEAAGLTVGTITPVFSERPVGHVATAGQDPLPGTPCVAPGSPVHLFVSQGPPPAGLVLSLNFDGVFGSGTKLFDASGSNNHGTITGATFVPGGKIGGALRFDGNDLVTVLDNDEATLDLTTGMTLEAWVNPTSTLSGWETALLKENGAGLSYALYAHDGAPLPGGTARPAGYINVGGIDVAARGIAPLTLNTWTHLAATYDNANLRLYVNGVLRRTVARTGEITVGDGPLRIGGNNAFPDVAGVFGGEFFRGLLDEVKVYNRALSAADINLDMGGTPPPQPTPVGGLVLSLDFNAVVADPKGTIVTDASGLGNHGTVNGAVAVAGGKGGALQFDGVSNTVVVADAPSLDLTAGMTIEAWVNPSVVGGLNGWESIVLKEGVEARTCCSNLLSYALYAHDAAAGPAGYIRSAGADQGIHTTPAIPAGAWTHLATTYDGTTLRIYVNGALASSRAQAGAIDPGDGVLRIGGNNAFPGEFFSGLIDEVKVYNRALSAAEINADKGAPPTP
jgi:Ca2+-binding RTX toxin-like protein